MMLFAAYGTAGTLRLMSDLRFCRATLTPNFVPVKVDACDSGVTHGDYATYKWRLIMSYHAQKAIASKKQLNLTLQR